MFDQMFSMHNFQPKANFFPFKCHGFLSPTISRSIWFTLFHIHTFSFLFRDFFRYIKNGWCYLFSYSCMEIKMGFSCSISTQSIRILYDFVIKFQFQSHAATLFRPNTLLLLVYICVQVFDFNIESVNA